MYFSQALQYASYRCIEYWLCSNVDDGGLGTAIVQSLLYGSLTRRAKSSTHSLSVRLLNIEHLALLDHLTGIS